MSQSKLVGVHLVKFKHLVYEGRNASTMKVYMGLPLGYWFGSWTEDRGVTSSIPVCCLMYVVWEVKTSLIQ